MHLDRQLSLNCSL